MQWVGRRCCAAGDDGRAAARPYRLEPVPIILWKWYESVFICVVRGDSWLNYGNKKMASPAFAGKAAGKIDDRILYVRAAGFLAAWSKIVLRTAFGTCSKVSGSME